MKPRDAIVAAAITFGFEGEPMGRPVRWMLCISRLTFFDRSACLPGMTTVMLGLPLAVPTVVLPAVSTRDSHAGTSRGT